MFDLITAAATTAADPTSTFLQAGVLGAVVVVLAGFAASAIKRERDRADRAEKELKELNALVRSDVIPVLVKANSEFARVAEALANFTAALRERR